MQKEINQWKENCDKKEIVDIIEIMAELQRQESSPTREGMIRVLSMAKSNAGEEIQKAEYRDGDVIPMSWSCFPDQDLYRKLSQYKNALRDKAIKKIGESEFERLVEGKNA